MRLWSQIRGFLRAFRAGPRMPAADENSASLARTLKETTHVRGGGSGAAGGLPRGSTEAHEKIVSKGHRDYTDSFKD